MSAIVFDLENKVFSVVEGEVMFSAEEEAERKARRRSRLKKAALIGGGIALAAAGAYGIHKARKGKAGVSPVKYTERGSIDKLTAHLNGKSESGKGAFANKMAKKGWSKEKIEAAWAQKMGAKTEQNASKAKSIVAKARLAKNARGAGEGNVSTAASASDKAKFYKELAAAKASAKRQGKAFDSKGWTSKYKSTHNLYWSKLG